MIDKTSNGYPSRARKFPYTVDSYCQKRIPDEQLLRRCIASRRPLKAETSGSPKSRTQAIASGIPDDDYEGADSRPAIADGDDDIGSVQYRLGRLNDPNQRRL